MIPFLTTLFGLLLGAIFDRDGGWLYGLLAGLGIGVAWVARLQQQRLEKEVRQLRFRVDRLTQQHHHEFRDEVARDLADAESTSESETVGQEASTPQAEHDWYPTPTAISTTEQPVDKPIERAPTPAVHEPQSIEQDEAVLTRSAESEWGDRKQDSRLAEPTPLEKAWAWLTGGNPMAKVGVLILFFGVAFLLKYLADQSLLSIAWRVSGVALAGLAMLLGGLYLKRRNRIFALIVQGGGLGVLYLTVFASLRLYQLIPAGLAFTLLVVLTAVGVLLAVWQNAMALAMLATAGGFLAPILASTGKGSHVALFSYYLVLNLGILSTAWFYSWRPLNLLGFVFTFGIGIAWGHRYYQPHFFDTVEPFLIIFFLLYLAVSILFAFRQPLRLRGFVDGTLVFGLPWVAFGLQSALLHKSDYGLAWTAVGLSALYAALTVGLWRRLQPESRLICEAFTALSIIFISLSIPLALSGQWTSGMWALEGAALVWVGVRQHRLLARCFGYLLQLGAAIAFLLSWADLEDLSRGEWIFFNAWFLGIAILSLSALFIANYLQRNDELVTRYERNAWPFMCLCWGLFCWYLAGSFELVTHLHRRWELASLMLFFTGSSVLAHHLQAWTSWRAWRLSAHNLLILLYGLFPVAMFEWERPMAGWLALSWPLALVGHYWILRRYGDWKTPFIAFLHLGAYWLTVLVITIQAIWYLESYQVDELWVQLLFALIPAAFMALVYEGRFWWPWPLRQHPYRYLHIAQIPVMVFLVFWFWGMNWNVDGGVNGVNYWPFINPMDISMALLMLLWWRWLRYPAPPFSDERIWRFDFAPALLGLSLFLWLNAQWIRFAHHFLHVPFNEDAMWASGQVQTGISILWSMIGLASMIWGARKALRTLWLCGAVLMGAVVFKLFMVDLANSGALERIVSFISVGLILLAVGYFSPVPPKEKPTETEDA